MIGNSLYGAQEREVLQFNDLFEAKKNTDGTIDFLVQYYNGGYCFEEAVEEALDNMKASVEETDELYGKILKKFMHDINTNTGGLRRYLGNL